MSSSSYECLKFLLGQLPLSEEQQREAVGASYIFIMGLKDRG